MRSYKYKELEDKDWLIKKYCIEQLSAKQIGELIGVKAPNSVRQALIRFNIEIRSRSDAQTLKNEDNFIFDTDVIYGSLLGDGSLKRHNKFNIDSQAYFHKKNIHYDHVKFVAQKIFEKDWESKISKSGSYTTYKNERKFHEHFVLRTLVHKELTAIYNDWYPISNNYIKVIPENIDPTPKMLLHMFLDDGSSFQRRKESVKKQIVIKICTDCFTRDNQEMFCEKINKKFNLKIRPTPYEKTFRMQIPQSKANDFYNIIGPPPFESLAYKWK